ncbi:MAG TPA: transposase [Chloroflexota bacterium]
MNRHRLDQGGNRQLNAVLHRIAVTRARHAPQARAYLDRRTAEGKTRRTRREGLRALKRYLVRAGGRVAILRPEPRTLIRPPRRRAPGRSLPCAWDRRDASSSGINRCA